MKHDEDALTYGAIQDGGLAKRIDHRNEQRKLYFKFKPWLDDKVPHMSTDMTV